MSSYLYVKVINLKAMLLTSRATKHQNLNLQPLLFLALLFVLPRFVTADNNALVMTTVNSIEPGQVTFGKPAKVSLSLDELPAEAMLALQPAAPFASHSIQFPQAATLLVKYKESVLTASGNTLYALNFAQSSVKALASIQLNNTITALQVYDNYLLCATATGELLLYDIDTDYTFNVKNTVNLGDSITAIAVDTDKAYVLVNKTQLTILRLSDFKAKPLTNITLQRRYHDLTVSGTTVYLTGDKTGVQIIDISNLNKPQFYPAFSISGVGQDVSIDNNLAFVAGGTAGMTVFDVSDPQQIRWLGNHNKMGSVYGVSVYQGIIAITNNANQRLVSLDVSNPLLPITDSIYTPQGRIHDLLVDWPYVYVAGSAGVERVDFSSSAAMQISNEGINQGGSRRAFIHDNIAYVADWFSGLHMYDISIPHAPRHLGNFHTPGSSKGVVVRDNIAFVGDDDHGVQVIDISDPQHPQKLSEVLSTGLAYTMKLVDDLIYLADHRGGFHIIDVSDVRHPTVIGSFDTPGKSWAIDVADGIAYVADDSSGLLVFDVRDPSAIALIGQFNPGGYAEDVKIMGQHAYVAFFDKGFYILDISNPREPQLTGHTPIPGNARSVSLDGPYAYIAGWESGLQVVDIRKLSAPQIVAYYDTDGSAWGLDIYNDHAYIWDWWGGVKVINISNPLQPQFAGQYHGKGLIQRLAIRGDYMYTANGAGGMQVYDIKNPLNPIWATGLDVSGSVRDIALTNDKAFLAADDEGIVIANISKPFYAYWQSRLQTPGTIQRLSADQSWLIAKDGRAGLLLIDASQPDNVRITDQLSVESNDFYLQGQDVYITSPEHGLQVYRIDSQQRLKLLTRYPTKQEARWVRVSNDYIALREARSGIHLLQLKDSHIQPVGFFAYEGTVEDMQIFGDRLYIASQATGILDIDISNPKNPTLSVLYPPTAVLGSLAINEQALFVGGDKTVNSVSRLGEIVIRRTSANDLELSLPSDLPLGNYQLSLVQPDGSKRVLEDSLVVKPAKSKKPKFTMEDFKKIMEQQKLNNPNMPSSP
ncbi:LVIVD repeat-containing protein [Kaarinaea lacus]